MGRSTTDVVNQNPPYELACGVSKSLSYKQKIKGKKKESPRRGSLQSFLTKKDFTTSAEAVSSWVIPKPVSANDTNRMISDLNIKQKRIANSNIVTSI